MVSFSFVRSAIVQGFLAKAKHLGFDAMIAFGINGMLPRWHCHEISENITTHQQKERTRINNIN